MRNTDSVPLLSVIIPTHKRPKTLVECLRFLESQTIAKQLEVIVVSDGHDEETVAAATKRKWSVPLQFFEIEKRQQGVARNRGIRAARAPYCLFIGDDIFLDARACEEHLRAHETVAKTAVLGHTSWNPNVQITPVMEWLERSGWQFAYPAIAQFSQRFIPEEKQHQFTYTSHISLPTALAKKHFFREDVSLYGWEDVEWGMRLRTTGIRLYYHPRAKALHDHRITMDDSMRRMEILGVSVVHMAKMLPEFDRMPHGWKRIAYEIASLLPTTAGKHRKAFLRGIRQAEKELRIPA
ncbi:MAG: glycosyltransferase [Candidatus Peribacteraceae bacterium]|nr:glycosyltransferase [Candidatus Peribacteraceae bacterium]